MDLSNRRALAVGKRRQNLSVCSSPRSIDSFRFAFEGSVARSMEAALACDVPLPGSEPNLWTLVREVDCTFFVGMCCKVLNAVSSSAKKHLYFRACQARENMMAVIGLANDSRNLCAILLEYYDITLTWNYLILIRDYLYWWVHLLEWVLALLM